MAEVIDQKHHLLIIFQTDEMARPFKTKEFAYYDMMAIILPQTIKGNNTFQPSIQTYGAVSNTPAEMLHLLLCSSNTHYLQPFIMMHNSNILSTIHSNSSSSSGCICHLQPFTVTHSSNILLEMPSLLLRMHSSSSSSSSGICNLLPFTTTHSSSIIWEMLNNGSSSSTHCL
jgi:hypothetical protein